LENGCQMEHSRLAELAKEDPERKFLLDRSSSHTASVVPGVPESEKGRQRWRGPRYLCGLREAGTPEHRRAPRQAKEQDVSRTTAAQDLYSERGWKGPKANFDSFSGR